MLKNEEYKYNLSYVKTSLRQETEQMYFRQCVVERDLKVRVYENAVVRPFMGVTVGENFLDESYLYVGHDVPRSFKFEDEDCVNKDEEVIYIGLFIDIWGHCLTDCMKHLWIFLKEEDRFKGKKLVWVAGRPNITIWDNFWIMLDMLGIDRKRIVQVTENTKYKKVYIPDHCFFVDDKGNFRFCTKEYGQLFDTITCDVEADYRYEKIYFTRTKLTIHNRDYGEHSVEKIFEKKGYKVLSPETLSVKEMIALLKGCKSFATTDGSIGHNSIFLPKNTECVFIRKADTVNSHQAPINQCRELEVTIIDSHWSKLLYYYLAPWDGPFFIYPGKNLKKWAGCGACFPFGDLMRYLIHGIMVRVRSKVRITLQWTERMLVK